MPMYDFQCPTCGKVVEKLVPYITRDLLRHCDSCLTPLLRLAPNPSFNTGKSTSISKRHDHLQMEETQRYWDREEEKNWSSLQGDLREMGGA